VTDVADHHDLLVLNHAEVNDKWLDRQGSDRVFECRRLPLDNRAVRKDFQCVIASRIRLSIDAAFCGERFEMKA
jgi:hypothetical protein